MPNSHSQDVSDMEYAWRRLFYSLLVVFRTRLTNYF